MPRRPGPGTPSARSLLPPPDTRWPSDLREGPEPRRAAVQAGATGRSTGMMAGMSDRTVVLRPGRALAFLADACDAAADQVAEGGDDDPELVVVYAELVASYARVLRPEVTKLPEGSVAWPSVVDHLLERLGQARRGEITLPLVEIADRLHGELHAVTRALF
jgi:hypothetical protein